MEKLFSYHQCCPVSADEICYKRVMDDKDLADTFTFSKAANSKEVLTKFLPMNMLHVIMTVIGGSDWCRM